MNGESMDGGELSAMAVIGKTSLVLLVILAGILACAWLLQRLRERGPLQHRLLKVVASTAVGNRERVVMVAVRDTWLVLGVTAGSISKLHELPAEEESGPPVDFPQASFAQRFNTVLRARFGSDTGARCD